MDETYPKPGRVGGRLIRDIISAFRAAGFDLPITSHILCAVSAGPDSTALAWLLGRYGRRVAPPSRISLLHVNHGWRGEASDGDERHAREIAARLGLEIRVERVPAPAGGESWEAHARSRRKEVFARLAAETGSAAVVTAHHGDDLAETLLWRLFTGASRTHGAGIRPLEGCEVRPLLGARKSDLVAFLEEEGVSWREDRTNQEGRFLRSRMRQELMPAIERLFPRAVEHLIGEA